MFGILNKDRRYLTGFVIHGLSFWLINRLTVSVEMKRKITSALNKCTKMRTTLLLWVINTDVALLVNLGYYLFYHEKSKIMWIKIKRCKINKMEGIALKKNCNLAINWGLELLSKSGN